MKNTEACASAANLSKMVKFSSIAGTLKVGGQILVAMIIYPAVIHLENVATLGSWLLLVAIVGYGGLTNLGMGPVLTKHIARTAMKPTGAARYSSLSDAMTCGILFSLVFTAVVFLLGRQIITIVQEGVDYKITFELLWIMLLGVLLRLISSIYGAIVAGYQRTYLVNLSQCFQLIIFTAVFFILPHTNGVLIDLAFAYTVGYVAELLFIVIVLFRLDAVVFKTRPTLVPRRIIAFLRSALPYSLMDASLIGREPLMKFALYLCCGSASVGIFELAMKIPFCIRQAFVFGLSALMPAFSNLSTIGAKDNIIALGRNAILYLLFGAIGGLFFYWLNMERILMIWLDTVSPEMLIMSKMLTIWWVIAALNVPAWWLGIAMGYQNSNMYIASTHIFITACLVMLARFVQISSLHLVATWVIGGVGMQVLLYSMLEHKTRMILPIYFSRQTVVAILRFSLLALLVMVCMYVMKMLTVPADVILVCTFLLYSVPGSIILLTKIPQVQSRLM